MESIREIEINPSGIFEGGQERKHALTTKLLTTGKIFCAMFSSTKGTGKTAKNARRYMDIKAVVMSATRCARAIYYSTEFGACHRESTGDQVAY